MKPTSPATAVRSPPPSRMTIRRGQPRNTRAPIITNIPSTNRQAGEAPAFARNSLAARAAAAAPTTMPMISGRMYCTLAALWSPRAPAMSRRKQAMQKPMFLGLPEAVRIRAAMPTATPAAKINPYSRNQLFSLINTLLTLFGAGMKIVTGAAHRNRLSRSRPPAAGSPGAPAAPAARTRPCRSRM